MKPHLFFRNPVEGVQKFKQPKRSFELSNAEDEEKNYEPIKETFKRCRDSFYSDREIRIRHRNPKLKIPAHIDYIESHFFDCFNSGKFENHYRNYFGLSPVVFKEYNSIGIFAVIHNEHFDYFLKQLELFISTENHTGNPPYDTHIKFIKEFYFLTTKRIIEFPELKEYVILNVLKNPELFQSHTDPIEQNLRDYLTERSVNYNFDIENERIELLHILHGQLQEIIDNFDIIHTVNSYSAGIIRPSIYNTPLREYGFTIANPQEDLPLIGIIDTGISNSTPLESLIINDGNEFDLTGTSPTLDEANHGTAVATLAALGRKLIPDHSGSFEADAKLLSIKTMNGTSGIIRISDVEALIRQAHQKYDCQIFTLTILFEQPLKTNANISEYACMLDKLADELNILVFISSGNSDVVENTIPPRLVNYPYHFRDEKRNICSPADTFNNIVIGAIADNFENNMLMILANDNNFPASYTRKHNIGGHEILRSSKRKSKHLYKPDIALQGGDYDNTGSWEYTGIKVPSTQTGIFFDRMAGTSLSAPLAANLAARLLKVYPSLGNNMQSVKALVINSASLPNMGSVFKSAVIDPLKLIGQGIPDPIRCLFSDDNSITLLLEDSIHPTELKTYSLNLPPYIYDLPNKKGVIEITSTLCYKIRPIPELHISYCPVCISFGFFNNREINNELSDRIKLKPTIPWSEDYYYAKKLLSNCQKMNFRLDKTPLQREDNTIKVAVNCKTHKLLNRNQTAALNYDMPFSLVINIKEVPDKGVSTGRLYAELIAINTVENIATLEATLENTV